jgi:hypothetical protein
LFDDVLDLRGECLVVALLDKTSLGFLESGIKSSVHLFELLSEFAVLGSQFVD